MVAAAEGGGGVGMFEEGIDFVGGEGDGEMLPEGGGIEVGGGVVWDNLFGG